MPRPTIEKCRDNMFDIDVGDAVICIGYLS